MPQHLSAASAAGRTASRAAACRLTGLRIFTVSAHGYDLVYVIDKCFEALLCSLEYYHIFVCDYLLVLSLDALIEFLELIGILSLNVLSHDLVEFSLGIILLVGQQIDETGVVGHALGHVYRF